MLALTRYIVITHQILIKGLSTIFTHQLVLTDLGKYNYICKIKSSLKVFSGARGGCI